MTVVLTAMFSLRVTALPLTWSQDSTGGMGILSFVTLFCIAAWIRLYNENGKKNIRYLICYFLMSLLLVVSKKAMLTAGIGEDYTGKLYGYSSVVVYVEAIALFMAFLYAKPIAGKFAAVINAAAKHSFSVYIIHFAMVGVLFTKIIPVDEYIGNVLTGISAVMFSCLAVYMFCVCVDAIKTSLGVKICNSMRRTKIVALYGRLTKYIDTLMN